MKKLIVTLAAVAIAAGVQAASFDWKCSATSGDVGDKVYLVLGSAAQLTWADEAAISTASFSQGVIEQHGSGSRATYNASAEGVSGITASDSVYAVIVSADGTMYGVGTPAAAAEFVYDPSAQQSSPGSMPIGFTTPTTPFAAVPEPTSGLLLFLGVAGLALKRRRA